MATFEFQNNLRVAVRQAAEREMQRGHARRGAASGRSALLATRRSLVPAMAAAVGLVVALAVATFVLLRTDPARETVGTPEVVARLALGDRLGDAVGAYGSVWVTDSGRAQLLRVDPDSRRVTDVVPVEDDLALEATRRTLWALNEKFPTPQGTSHDVLLGIDPRRSAVAARVPLRMPSGEPFAPLDLAADGDNVWILGTTARLADDSTLGLLRVDAGTRRITAALSLSGGWGRAAIALRNDGLWAITADNRLLRFDAQTGSKVSDTRLRLPLADGEGAPTRGRLQFAGGMLVTSVRGGLAGIDPHAGRVVWRRQLGQNVNAWTAADGLVWAIVRPQGPDQVVALDPADGRVATRIGIGTFGATAITSIGDELWTTTPIGQAVVLQH